MQSNERRTKVRTGHVLPKVFCESGHVHPHIELRRPLQSNYASGKQISRYPVVAEESLEIGGGELDEGLEEVPLFGVVARCVPEPFENFVAFPPVGVVVEIDSIQVIL